MDGLVRGAPLAQAVDGNKDWKKARSQNKQSNGKLRVAKSIDAKWPLLAIFPCMLLCPFLYCRVTSVCISQEGM